MQYQQRIKSHRNFRYYILGLLIIYKSLLDVCYFTVLSPTWDYFSFTLNWNFAKELESYILLIIVFVFMPKESKKISHFLTWMLVLFAYIPLLTIYAFRNESQEFMYFCTIFFLILFIVIKLPVLKINNLCQRQIKPISNLIIILAILAVFVFVFKYQGFSILLSLKDVYNIRAEFYSQNNNPLFNYLLPWVASVFIPFGLAISFVKRKWLILLILIYIQILLFSATGNKGWLFEIPFVIGITWIFKKKQPIIYMCWILIAVVTCGLISYRLFNDVWVTLLFANRTLLLPASLSFYYYDFFSHHDFLYLALHKPFNLFLQYNYAVEPPYIIANEYFGRPEMRANNGLLADAYMNFGFWGVIIWPILIGFLLKIADSFSRNKDICVVSGGMALFVLSMTNIPLLTTLLTKGMLLALVLLYLLPESNNKVNT